MALVLANRVQESATANTTVSFTLTGAVAGFQSFAVIGDTNTTFYSATDGSGNWEVGLGTYSTTGPTLTRTTIYASSNSNNAVTFSGAINVFVTYPSGRSVNLDASGNVSALGTVASGTWQGTTVGVAYGGTGVTSSSGANSVMLRDANQNVAVNRLNQSNTSTSAAGGTTALTAASSYIHTLVGTGGQTYTMPDATTLTTGVAFVFNNMATGTLTIQNYATGSVGTIPAGGAGAVFLTDNTTTGGIWDIHAYLPEGVTFGTNAFNLGSSTISGGTWQGGTIQPGYGGTGLTSYTTNGAVYATGTTTLTSGTLPVIAGGTGATATPTNGQLLIGNGTNYSVASLGTGTGISTTTGSGTLTINNTGVTSLAGTSPVNASASTGSVTVSLASGYGDTQNPYASKTANFFLAAPNGTAGVPTFRAIVAADIPTLNQNTTGSAGSVANAVTFNNGGTGDVSGTTFNGSAARTISYNTVGAPSTTGTNATGTWGISISGNAATATTASNVNNGTLTLAVSGTGLSGSQTFTANQSTNATFTVTSNATNANTASTIVARDASGNFSAGTITATLSGNATNVSGTVAVANGGTGLTSGTSGGVLYYSATGTLASSGALTANAIMVGGGAGVAPSTITTGTGVVTALGVNTGTAGAFVVNGGALGTPSSGTVTNLTGTASININGTVGATTPNTGAFTSVTSTSASGILTRAAATQDGVALVGRAGGTSSYEVTLTPTTLSADRTLTLPNNSGTVLTTGATVTVAQGGTGATTLTANNVILGNGTSAVQFVAPGTNGNVLTSNGTTWTSAAAPAATTTISDDTSTNATRYLTFTSATSGTVSTLNVSSTKLTYNPSTGALSSTTVAGSSDERLKTNWRSLQTDFIEQLATVKAGVYDRTDMDVPVTQVGVTAQSLRSVLPNAVLEDVDGMLSVAYGNAALVSAVELAKRVVEQEARINRLEALVAKLIGD